MATQNDDTFYIVDEELALLTPAAKKAWENRLKKETLTAYETPAQIDARMKAVNYAQYPELQKQIDGYVSAIKAGKAPKLEFNNFPEEAVGSFLFSIGASGMSFYIHLYLQDKKTQENAEVMEAVAALSRARHTMLQKNEAVFATK